MTNHKFMGLLKSRKFWASVISLAVALGLLEYSESQQADLVQAILTIVTAIGYIFSVALEDGLRNHDAAD